MDCAGGYVVDWVPGRRYGACGAVDDRLQRAAARSGPAVATMADVLRWLRQKASPHRVIIVTARDRVADRIAGLDAGRRRLPDSNPSNR